jgi:Fur family iron response transcriptional regulator
MTAVIHATVAPAPANGAKPARSPVRPYAATAARLTAVGLRPTRQRLALAKILFDGVDRHVTAEVLCDQATRLGIKVSLATIYNTLNQFTESGLLRQVVVDGDRTYFDTNVTAHHHFYRPDSSELIDIPGDMIQVDGLPTAPAGTKIAGIEVIVRLVEAP